MVSKNIKQYLPERKVMFRPNPNIEIRAKLPPRADQSETNSNIK